MNRYAPLTLCFLLAACDGEPSDTQKGAEETPLEDYEAAAKADSWRAPTEHGTLAPGLTSNASFDDDALFHSWAFALTGDAKVSLKIDGSDKNLDTVMYLYSRQAGEARWGRYIGKNDDANGGVFSQIDKAVGEGEFRIMVKGFKRALRGHFTLTFSCDGAGCPAGDDGGVDLPSAGDYTKECAGRLTKVLDSQMMGGDAWSVKLDDVGRLPKNAQIAVGLYETSGAIEWYGEDELAELELDVELRSTEDGQLIDVTDGGDESNVTYVFGGEGELVMSYFHNQSPWVDWYCAREGEAPAPNAEPSEWCASAMISSIPHDQDEDGDSGGVVPSDEATPFANHAAAVYRKALELDDDVQVVYDGRAWTDGWVEGAELTVKAEGHEAATYLLGGDSEVWALFERTADGDVALCVNGDDL